jgi:hypothetical protein
MIYAGKTHKNRDSISPETSERSPEIPERSPETSERPPETSERSPEIPERPPETSERSPETSEHSPEIPEHPPETFRRLRKNKLLYPDYFASLNAGAEIFRLAETGDVSRSDSHILFFSIFPVNF